MKTIGLESTNQTVTTVTTRTTMRVYIPWGRIEMFKALVLRQDNLRCSPEHISEVSAPGADTKALVAVRVPTDQQVAFERFFQMFTSGRSM